MFRTPRYAEGCRQTDRVASVVTSKIAGDEPETLQKVEVNILTDTILGLLTKGLCPATDTVKSSPIPNRKAESA
jgi:hypothetical protein